MKEKLLLIAFGLMLVLGVQAQEMKGRIYYNGNMSVAHLMSNKSDETPEAREEREGLMNEIFTMSVTVEFPDSYKMKVKMRILTDKERADQLGISWAKRKLWQTQLQANAKIRQYWSRYRVIDGAIVIEDGTKMLLSEDGEELTINDDLMEATLKRIR
jgi:hypothetical protein